MSFIWTLDDFSTSHPWCLDSPQDESQHRNPTWKWQCHNGVKAGECSKFPPPPTQKKKLKYDQLKKNISQFLLKMFIFFHIRNFSHGCFLQLATPWRSTHETVLAMLEARCDPNPPHRGVARWCWMGSCSVLGAFICLNWGKHRFLIKRWGNKHLKSDAFFGFERFFDLQVFWVC